VRTVSPAPPTTSAVFEFRGVNATRWLTTSLRNSAVAWSGVRPGAMPGSGPGSVPPRSSEPVTPPIRFISVGTRRMFSPRAPPRHMLKMPVAALRVWKLANGAVTNVLNRLLVQSHAATIGVRDRGFSQADVIFCMSATIACGR
jgi:hypothetical protein